MGTTKGVYSDGIASQYDSVSHERVQVSAPVLLTEDFVGPGHTVPAAGSPAVGYPWVKKIVGAAPPTVAKVASVADGIMRCALTATSEKQDAALYLNDILDFDASKGVVLDCVAALSVLPSGAGAQMVLGFSSAWIDGPDNASFYIQFGCKANGAVSMRTKDGVTTNEVATGVTLVAGVKNVFRVDAGDPTNVKFFINGIRVGQGYTFAATGANALLQPYCSMYKASRTVVGTLDVDAIRAWQVARS